MIDFEDLHPEIALEWVAVTAETEDLLLAERLVADAMVTKRRAEFAAGRRAARRAMVRLGHPATALPRGTDRAPCWPRGLIGAITHTELRAGAVVGRAGRLAGIGLDLEVVARLDDEVGRRICRPGEWAALAALDEEARRRRITRVFAAKECVQKAWGPMGGAILPFDAVTIHETEHPGGGEFTIEAHDARLVRSGRRWVGRFGESATEVAALLLLFD